jgi:hypothetical protein
LAFYQLQQTDSSIDDVASPGIPSWNQLRAFLEQMCNLQKAGFAAA